MMLAVKNGTNYDCRSINDHFHIRFYFNRFEKFLHLLSCNKTISLLFRTQTK